MVRRYWWALEADFHREYQVTDPGALTIREFWVRVAGLSPDSVWRRMVDNHPRDVTRAEADAITAQLAA